MLYVCYDVLSIRYHVLSILNHVLSYVFFSFWPCCLWLLLTCFWCCHCVAVFQSCFFFCCCHFAVLVILLMLSLILLSFAARCHFAVVDILLVFSMLLLLSFCCWRFASCSGPVILLLSSFCCFCHVAAVVIAFVVVICFPIALTCVIFLLLSKTVWQQQPWHNRKKQNFLKSEGRSSAPGLWRELVPSILPAFTCCFLLFSCR